MCKVSVIIPVYNTAPYLYEAINSILNQTLNDIEIICVDDGSTDNSFMILKEFEAKDDRIVVVSQSNQGQSAARNTAMRHAHGEYIYFMDSDDVLMSDALDKCYSYCRRYGFDFCFFDGDIFSEEGAKELSWDYHRTEAYQDNFCYNGMELMDKMLDTYTFRAVPWLLFIRRGYIEKIGITFYPGIIHEDELYSVLLHVQADKVGCLKQSFVKHRVRATSTMGKRYSLRNVDCYLTVVGELHRWAGNDELRISMIRKYSRYTLNAVFSTAFVLNFKDKFVAYFKLLRMGYVHYLSINTQIKFWIKSLR